MGKSSISALRSRVGSAPLRDLVQCCCLPLANAQDHPQTFYAGLRLVALDASIFELPDEADNAHSFGYSGSRTSVAGHAGYPHARCAVLVECATHAILGANLGPYRTGEWELTTPLLARLVLGMLCMAARGLNGFEHWRQAQAAGAELLWRCSSTRQLPVQRVLDDGSFLSVIRPTGVGRAQAAEQAITVRVIEYALPGLDDAQPRYRLLTTLLYPQLAPSMELAALYHQRWEIEAVFDELKTHLRQSRRVLRSKTPQLVRQEFYGWVLAHYAVRWLLHQGATRHRVPHAELSFKGHVELLRRTQPQSGAFPPERPRRRRRWFRELLQASARTRATRTLNRRSPRVVQRRNSRYAPRDRSAPTRVAKGCTPCALTEPPCTPTPRAARIRTHLWSPTNPLGSFVI